MVTIGCQKNMENSAVKILNSPLKKVVNLKSIDGKNIVNALQYQLLINLNLTLLEYDKDTNLVTLLAEDYDIQNNQINFKIRKGVKTISGHEIKAIDAEVSLKRLINSNGNHSRLSELLCSVEDGGCKNIYSKDYKLTLTAKKTSYIPFILKLLTSADNVILPVTSLSSELPDSEIVNFRETSGPYYINENIENKEVEHIKLQLNSNHYLSNDQMAKEVNYTLAPYENLISNEKLLSSKFNYIHNVTTLDPGQIKKLNVPSSNVHVFPTVPIKNTMIFTTEIGRKKFSIKELLYSSLIVRDSLLSNIFLDNDGSSQVEFFPIGGDGQLKDEELTQVVALYSTVKNNPITNSKKIKLGVYESSFEKFKLFLKDSNIEIVRLKNSPFENNSENVDIFIDTVDSSFMETLDLLEFNKSLGIFNASDIEIQKYIDTEEKEKRIEILRRIHLRSLLEARFINVAATPYYTLVGKDWIAHPPTYFVGFPVWKIKIKNF